MKGARRRQVILRDHGYERVEMASDEWTIFWCAGQVDPTLLRQFRTHQKVNKFPKANALTLKSNLWSHFARMLQKFGCEHFDFMPHTYVLPNQVHERLPAVAHRAPRPRCSRLFLRGACSAAHASVPADGQTPYWSEARRDRRHRYSSMMTTWRAGSVRPMVAATSGF